eukprot:7010222-Pyramimonas_sp.AAC.2
MSVRCGLTPGYVFFPGFAEGSKRARVSCTVFIANCTLEDGHASICARVRRGGVDFELEITPDEMSCKPNAEGLIDYAQFKVLMA